MTEIGRGSIGRVYKTGADSVKLALKKYNILCDGKDMIQSMIRNSVSRESNGLVSIQQGVLQWFKQSQNYIKLKLYMELGQEENLNDYILQQKPGLSECILLFKDITHGLKHLHENKIVHKNLHPNNVLIFKQKSNVVCKISDTLDGALCCKWENVRINSFSAPECVNLTFDLASDIFSLATILYFMVAQEEQGGKLVPFLGKFMMATSIMRSAHIYKDIKPYFLDNDKLAKLVSSMLQKDPTLRPDVYKVFDILMHIKY